MQDEILNLLKDKHPQSKDELFKSLQTMALDHGGINPTLQEFEATLSGMFNLQEIVFTSAPGPHSLDFEETTVELNWVDLVSAE
jgi:hypothetical protein